MKIKLTEELWKEGNMYVSYCPELDITSCGDSIEALACPDKLSLLGNDCADLTGCLSHFQSTIINQFVLSK